MTEKSTNHLHSWEVTPSEAVALQKRLRERVIIQPLADDIELVGGADISYNRFSDRAYAGIVVLRLPELEVVTTAGAVATMTFPYVPGLLSFREAPALLAAWEQLIVRPDVLVLDGMGIAHPRRFGIASHIGVLLDVPTIGCGKTLLTGKYKEPAATAGSFAPLVDRGETIGVALRTKDRVKPVFISPGHRADIPTSVALMMRCVQTIEPRKTAGKPPLSSTPARLSRYRIPEPTRLAHLLVNDMRRRG